MKSGYEISLKSEISANSVFVRRDLYRNTIIFQGKEYPELRTFYNKMQAKDQENVVVSVATPAGTN